MSLACAAGLKVVSTEPAGRLIDSLSIMASVALEIAPSVPFTGLLKASSTVLSPSGTLSSRIGTTKVWLVSPGRKTSVPFVLL